MFLINRYAAELCLLAVTNQMSGFTGNLYNNQKCKILISTLVAYSIFSTFTPNLIAFLRVIVLWDKSPRIVLGLSIVLALCTLCSIASVTGSIIILKPSMTYNPLTQMCVITKTDPTVITGFVGLAAFELSVLFLTTYNALSRPRDSTKHLMRILYRDSILFFVAVTIFRMTNLISVTVLSPEIFALPLVFTWAMVTLATNRLLISLRSSEKSSECEDREDSDFDEDVPSSPTVSGSTESGHPNLIPRNADIELCSYRTT